jgi:hypothetical protein
MCFQLPTTSKNKAQEINLLIGFIYSSSFGRPFLRDCECKKLDVLKTIPVNFRNVKISCVYSS